MSAYVYQQVFSLLEAKESFFALPEHKEKEFNEFRESTAEVLSATDQNPRWW
jgi:hypothetical protein